MMTEHGLKKGDKSLEADMCYSTELKRFNTCFELLKF